MTVESYRHSIDINESGAILFGGQLADGAGIYLFRATR